MRLIYKETGKEVKEGDIVDLGKGEMVEITYFREPHKSSSSGKVQVGTVNSNNRSMYYVGVIGAEWVEREDRS